MQARQLSSVELTFSGEPWGSIEQYTQPRPVTVKILYVWEGLLSSQSHERRDEYLRVIDGSGYFVFDGSRIPAATGSTFHVPKNEKHRYGSDAEMRVLELHIGFFDEKDIKRYDDIYRRMNLDETARKIIEEKLRQNAAKYQLEDILAHSRFPNLYAEPKPWGGFIRYNLNEPARVSVIRINPGKGVHWHTALKPILFEVVSGYGEIRVAKWHQELKPLYRGVIEAKSDADVYSGDAGLVLLGVSQF